MICASCRVRASTGRIRINRQRHPSAPARAPPDRHAPAAARASATGCVQTERVSASADQAAVANTAATAMEKHVKNADPSRRSAPRSPAPLPTNSPPLAPQTDTTSAVFSAGYKLEGGGRRQRDAAAQKWKYFLLYIGGVSASFPAKGVGCDKRRPGSNPGFSVLSVFREGNGLLVFSERDCRRIMVLR